MTGGIRDLAVLFPDAEMRTRRAELRDRWYELGYFGDLTLDAHAARTAREHPGTRLVFAREHGDEVLTIAELWARATRWAAAFRELGVERGDRVALQLPNSPELSIALYGALSCGAVVVGIADSYRDVESRYILERSQPKVYIAPTRWRGVGADDRLRYVAGLASDPTVVLVGDPVAAARGFDDVERSHADAAEPRPAGHRPDDPAIVIYTSGTTGSPKGVVHSHNSLAAACRATVFTDAARAQLSPWAAGHIAGMMQVVGPTVRQVDMVVLERWDPVRAAQLVEEFGVTEMSGVPTMLWQLFDHYRESGLACPIRNAMTGGAGVPPALLARADSVGCTLVRCYGSSEHPNAAIGRLEDPLERRAEADGMPTTATEIAVVDDDGRPLPAGRDGEVVLIGPQQFLGYTEPALNTDSFLPGAWLRTGDIGRLDGGGRLAITDRKKDLIIRGGENIASVDVEDVLLRHPAIVEAAAVAVPHDVLGEQVCACLLVRDGSTVDLDDLRRLFRDAQVAMFKCPEQILILDDFPRTPSGKVQKAELRRRLRALPDCPAGSPGSS